MASFHARIVEPLLGKAAGTGNAAGGLRGRRGEIAARHVQTPGDMLHSKTGAAGKNREATTSVFPGKTKQLWSVKMKTTPDHRSRATTSLERYSPVTELLKFCQIFTGKEFVVTSLLRAACVLLLTSLTACAPFGSTRPDQYKYEKPRVAVLEFENKASLSNQWKLSEGMRDMLVDALVKTDSYTVLTRNDLGAVLSELDLQGRPHFREQGKLQQGKLKNVQYLIKGSVTDFAHVGGGAFSLAASDLGLGISSDVAVVSLTLYVIDVESGEIVASKSMEGKANAGSVDFVTTYKDVAIGGKSFYRTPLGKATKKVMDQCLQHIAQVIATQQWYPSVVKVNGPSLIISGGADRHVTLGSLWSAYEKGEPLIDPNTGDVLGQGPGKYSGRIRVTEVLDKYSKAEILEGAFREGQNLRPELQLPEQLHKDRSGAAEGSASDTGQK